MNKYALITGASSGIGEEFAKIFAREGWNLIITARRKEKLETLKTELLKEYKVDIKIIINNLANIDESDSLFNEVKTMGIVPSALINNAGFGANGAFHKLDWQRQSDMMNLNMIALTKLTYLFLPDMIINKSGYILNVASTAGFLPGPFMAVYYATKAYVISFSEAIENELRGSGVSVTALCPGATQSEFQSTAGLDNAALFNAMKLPTSLDVAEYGYKAMLNKKSLAVHGTPNKLMSLFIKFVPRSALKNIARKLQEPKR